MTTSLSKQFSKNPGLAFLDVIKASSTALSARIIMAEVVAEGFAAADVRAKWKTAQPYINEHPCVLKPTTLTYAWSDGARSAADCLAALAGRVPARVPAWLTVALRDAVARGLGGADGFTSSTDAPRGQLADARVAARFAAAIDEMTEGGADSASVRSWLTTQGLKWYNAEPIEQVGVATRFDPMNHQTVGGVVPAAQSPVVIVRPGYRWLGEEPGILISRALVRPV